MLVEVRVNRTLGAKMAFKRWPLPEKSYRSVGRQYSTYPPFTSAREPRGPGQRRGGPPPPVARGARHRTHLLLHGRVHRNGLRGLLRSGEPSFFSVVLSSLELWEASKRALSHHHRHSLLCFFFAAADFELTRRVELFFSEYLAGRPRPQERPLLARPKSCSLADVKAVSCTPFALQTNGSLTVATLDFTSWPSGAVVSFQECDLGPQIRGRPRH